MYQGFGPLMVKGETLPSDDLDHGYIANDFYESQIGVDCFEGEEPDFDPIYGRWASYDYEAEFFVYDEEFTKELISILQNPPKQDD